MIRIQEEDFSVDAVLDSLKEPFTGAVVLFIGLVRQERGLEAINVESYEEMAEEKMREIENQATGIYKLQSIVMIHRVGHLKIGEKIVLIAASASHREQAFEACRFALEQLKTVVPIWKENVEVLIDEDG